MQQLIAQKDTRPCLICSRQGTRHAVEVLPDGGILFMVAHDDGQICKWAEYSSISNVTKPQKKKAGIPTYVKCPKCGDRGRLNWAYDIHANKEERPFMFTYIVIHERIPGTWGQVKVKRHRRCQSFTSGERIEILKQVGRYIADPPKPNLKQRDLLQKKSGSNVEPVFQNQNGVKAEKQNSIAQAKQHKRKTYEGPIYIPKGKRLTICTRCNKPGYKYKTYFEHYNEPPIGPRMLRGTHEGWRYRRCYFTKGKVKHEQDNTNRKISSTPGQVESVKSSQDIVLQRLDRYVEESSSGRSKEGDPGKDYKKMYWDLVDNLRKMVGDIDRVVDLADNLRKIVADIDRVTKLIERRTP